MEFFQFSCMQTKGNSYLAKPADAGTEASDSCYQVFCQHAKCPFFLEISYNPGTKSCGLKDEFNLTHEHPAPSQKQPESSRIVKSASSDPFVVRNGILHPVSSSSIKYQNASLPTGTPTQVLMYSSVEGTHFDFNSPESSLSSTPNISNSTEPVEFLFKKRVKEIKDTFKQIHDAHKLSSAEEVLQLLRRKSREYPASSSSFSSSSIPTSAVGKSINYIGNASDTEETVLENAVEFPSFTISERKRKQVGTYRCRICRREGHNSRSCDASLSSLKQLSSPMQDPSHHVIITTGEISPELTIKGRTRPSNSLNSSHVVSVVVGDELQHGDPHNLSISSVPDASLLLSDSMSFADDDIIRESLIMRQSQSRESDLIIVNVGGEQKSCK